MPELILASTSPYRRALLERLGVPFRCIAPGVDEVAAAAGLSEPEAVVRARAKAKAMAVARTHPFAIVIGSDQVCVLGDAILDKPGTAAAAVQQLLRLHGREHRLLTAVVVAYRAQTDWFVDQTRLRMAYLTEPQIERYVAADQPLDCAGSYKIESRGIALFEAIHTHDHTAIIGLPMLRLCRVLRELGLELP